MHLTTPEKLTLKMGTDDRHTRAANEFTDYHNGQEEVLEGETKAIKLTVRRVLSDGLLTKDLLTNRYYFVQKKRGVVSGQLVSSLEVHKFFNQYKNETRPWADRYRNPRLYRKPLFNEKAIKI